VEVDGSPGEVTNPMIEIRCPFCEAPAAVELAALHALACVIRCDGCGVAVEVADGESAAEVLPLAA
jgi:hypothetical protein